MPIPGELFFDNIIYEDHLKYPNVTVEVQPETVFELIDNTKVAWAIDGDYVPTIEITFFDGTNQTIVANDISIHVYPQEELTQIETNKVSVIITLALFIFSAVGVVTLFFDLWDSEEKVCKYEKESKSETAKSNGTHNYSNKFKTKSGGKKT